MTKTIWNGTVDNLELSGKPNGDRQPMRITEDADGELMTEFAFSTENEEGEIEYDESRWEADYQIRFRDMQPELSDELQRRAIQSNILDAWHRDFWHKNAGSE